jgi:hypothetical protein
VNVCTDENYADNGTARFYVFSFVVEGTTEKALQFKSIYNKNLCVVEQKMYFSTLHRGSINIKSINLIDIIFVKKFFSGDLFRAAPYSLN